MPTHSGLFLHIMTMSGKKKFESGKREDLVVIIVHRKFASMTVLFGTFLSFHF